MSKRIFIIDENGDIHGLYDETIDFRELGHCHIERASNVEWDDGVQAWVVVLLEDGMPICSRPTRKQAIEAEIDWLNKNRIAVEA